MLHCPICGGAAVRHDRVGSVFIEPSVRQLAYFKFFTPPSAFGQLPFRNEHVVLGYTVSGPK